MPLINEQTQNNYDSFIKGLTELSKKYGVALNVTGGVYIYEPEILKNIEYTNDVSSGDISYNLNQEA